MLGDPCFGVSLSLGPIGPRPRPKGSRLQAIEFPTSCLSGSSGFRFWGFGV